MRTLVFALLVALALPAVAADTLEGRWRGPIRLLDNGVSEAWVDLRIERAGDGWTGNVRIAAVTAREAAPCEIGFDGKRVTLVVRGEPGNPTFNGVLAGDKLSGDFRHDGKTFPFLLTRATP